MDLTIFNGYMCTGECTGIAGTVTGSQIEICGLVIIVD